MKYMTYQEWINTPSRKDGFSEDQEWEFVNDVCDFISSIAIRMNIPLRIIATAMVYFHQYTRKHSFREFDKFIVGISALYLACKVENNSIHLTKLIEHYYSLGSQVLRLPAIVLNDSKIRSYKERICEKEYEILKDLGYDLDVELPFPYIEQMRGYLQEFYPEEASKIISVATNFCNDSSRTPICLFYHPMEIAATCIHMALIYLNISSLPPEWFTTLHPDINLPTIKNISGYMKKLFALHIQKNAKKIQQTQQIPAQNNNPSNSNNFSNTPNQMNGANSSGHIHNNYNNHNNHHQHYNNQCNHNNHNNNLHKQQIPIQNNCCAVNHSEPNCYFEEKKTDFTNGENITPSDHSTVSCISHLGGCNQAQNNLRQNDESNSYSNFNFRSHSKEEVFWGGNMNTNHNSHSHGHSSFSKNENVYMHSNGGSLGGYSESGCILGSNDMFS